MNMCGWAKKDVERETPFLYIICLQYTHEFY